jgi:hypothetical protein
MARPAGFEPATCGFEVRRSIRAELRAHEIRTGLLIGNRPLIVKGLSKTAYPLTLTIYYYVLLDCDTPFC